MTPPIHLIHVTRAASEKRTDRTGGHFKGNGCLFWGFDLDAGVWWFAETVPGCAVGEGDFYAGFFVLFFGAFGVGLVVVGGEGEGGVGDCAWGCVDEGEEGGEEGGEGGECECECELHGDVGAKA